MSDFGNDRHFASFGRQNSAVQKISLVVDKDKLVRFFTVQAFENCDILVLPFRDILKMKLEFPKVFFQLFEDVKALFNRELKLKLEIIRKSEEVKL